MSNRHRFCANRDRGIAEIQRAVQDATTPTLGQQMFQQGSRSAIADDRSREESSVSINLEGRQVAK